jgi:hypothetical protein
LEKLEGWGKLDIVGGCGNNLSVRPGIPQQEKQ